MNKSNPFSLSFGKEPVSYIARDYQSGEILESFDSDNPSYQVCMITGVRGAGKTVAMSAIANILAADSRWIIVNLNPERDLLRTLAAELSNRKELFELFRDAKINLSFLGFGVYGVPKRNADRPAWGNCAAAGGNINRRKWESLMRWQAVDRG